METKSVRKPRKKVKIKKKVKFKLRFFIFIALLFLLPIGAVYFLFFRKEKEVNYLEKAKNYYQSSFSYDKALRLENENLFYASYTYQEGQYKKIKTGSNIADKTKISLAYNLIQEIGKYFDENKLNLEDLHLYIKDLNTGQIFSQGGNTKLSLFEVNRILTGMVIYDGIKSGTISISDSVLLTEGALASSSYYFDRGGIGKYYSLKELLNLGLNNKDQTAINMMQNHIVNKYKKGLAEVYSSLYAINFDGDALSLNDIGKLMDRLYNNTDIYSYFANISSQENMDLFLNSMFIEKVSYNIKEDKESYKFDAGLVDSNSRYVYVVYSDKLSKKVIQDLGDIVNRNIDQYSINQLIFK